MNAAVPKNGTGGENRSEVAVGSVRRSTNGVELRNVLPGEAA